MKIKNTAIQNKSGIKTREYLFFKNSVMLSFLLNNNAPLIIKNIGTAIHPNHLKIIAKYQKLQ